MGDPEFLAPSELHTLTGFARAAEQDGWLTEKSIPHQRDGRRVIVSRFHPAGLICQSVLSATDAKHHVSECCASHESSEHNQRLH